ncbi:hypothetical protein OZ682_003686 [Yersinia enterocolitica]
MDITKSREEFEAWIAKWADTSKEAITALRNPDESDIDTYISDVIDDEALQFFIVGYAAWQAARESIEVELPTQDEYDDPLSAYNAISDCKKILRTAGIRIKGESDGTK